MVRELLRCTECNAVLPLTELKLAVELERYNEEYGEKAAGDARSFYHRHWDHKMETLTVKEESCMNLSSDDPGKAVFIEATNGRETFVIKRCRRNPRSPLFYDLVRESVGIG